ncbi:ADP-heptose:LPS heptosyltransferase [Legionella oakridgensis ATCC 33761 = DSM 21215]|uniref:ADP-heptose:LPS heptosyltransferase n=3 Tax=Legionella oakridgensis TaxID=29423 RepID=W0BEA8_9GAMM|nr:ADP-heptose:LPS heptosyltransferase [Legionella oakridgensis ATCC 33761 = DSM 21215]ETO92290.1 ADP-heptose:LPS heptosyltransferase [Legionella oakridgensis RV-2-2007]KTD39598.1 heptosyl transferase, glycosyltransferase family 9 protein [Legionella oakridgensis]STY21166.1 heptosyl transferase, glycosyltransferase family 9 protein [Legionella longbeachae]
MLVPLIRTLQANIPDVSLTWIISRPAYDLVEGLDGVEFIVIPKPSNVADYWRFNKQMRSRHFDVLLATQASFRANFLYPFIRASRKIGYDVLRAKDGHHWFVGEKITPGNDHTLEGFLKFAEALGAQKKEIRWDLPISASDHDWARKHLPQAKGPVMLINPAASKPERSWLIEHYIQIIRHVQSRWRAQVVLTGGPGEYDRLLADAIIQNVSVIDLVGKTKPKQLLALLQQADLVLCPDTGPSHMATAVGTPVIALHAVTSADVSGPYLYRHLAVDYYPEAVKTVLQKTASSNRWGTHAHGAETMSLIPVGVVKERLDSVLSGLGYQ